MHKCPGRKHVNPLPLQVTSETGVLKPTSDESPSTSTSDLQADGDHTVSISIEDSEDIVEQNGAVPITDNCLKRKSIDTSADVEQPAKRVKVSVDDDIQIID